MQAGSRFSILDQMGDSDLLWWGCMDSTVWGFKDLTLWGVQTSS